MGNGYLVKGIGSDIIEVERIEKDIEEHGERFLDRLFTPSEQAYCLRHRDSSRHFAGRFAAKEAVAKALGTGFDGSLQWKEIEILNDEKGKPFVIISPHAAHALKYPKFIITISHCRLYATATALLIADA